MEKATNRKKAIGAAAHEVLNELLPYFKDNLKIKKTILKVLYPEEYLQLEKDSWKIKKLFVC